MKEKENKTKNIKQKKTAGKRKTVSSKKRKNLSLKKMEIFSETEKRRSRKKRNTGKEKSNKEKFLWLKKIGEFARKPIIFSVFRATIFTLILAVVFFLTGSAVWEIWNFSVVKIEEEELSHTLKIKTKLFEMKSQIDFFEKKLEEFEQKNSFAEDELKEINENSRNLLGELNDLERYYLDRRFDYSLEFLQPISMEDDEKYEQLKRIIRDGELFLDDMKNVGLFSQADQSAKNIVRYDFKIFKENYLKAFKNNELE